MTTGLLLLTVAAGAEPARPVDFDTEIIPVLTKSGCNAGACHGAALGKKGFRLTLRGYDPSGDFLSISALASRKASSASCQRRTLSAASPFWSAAVNLGSGGAACCA